MGSGRSASVGVVAELMDVEATLGIWVLATDIERDAGGGALASLFEGYGALDIGVTSNNSNCFKLLAISHKI